MCSVQTGREATHMIFPVNVSTVQTQVTDVKRKLRSSTVLQFTWAQTSTQHLGTRVLNSSEILQTGT